MIRWSFSSKLRREGWERAPSPSHVMVYYVRSRNAHAKMYLCFY